MQLGSLQYPHNPMKGASEHFHFLSVLAGTYDDTARNINIGRVGYLRHSFIAGFPTERVPKMPLSGVSTRSGVHLQKPGRHDDGPVHSFGGLPAGDALRHGRLGAGLMVSYENMFEGSVTGNIPEVLDNGEVTDGTHVTAGQLALALTPYAQVTELAVNTAASGNNAAAIQSLDARVTAELASKLDSSALAPAIAPLDGSSIAAAELADHGSLQQGRPVGL